MSIDRGKGIAISAVLADSFDVEQLIDNVEAAQAAAEAAQAAAETAETNAETAETNAETAETNAASSASAAATSESNIAGSEAACAASETAAAASETAAAASETAAAASETAAAASEAAAATSETNAATSETNAASSATSASTSASSASSSASSASTSATAAASSASAASTSETNAAASATSASTSASTATTQASNASTSASNAATSASNASTSETNAATSASNASTSETNAATSATNASTSASNAATSETNAATSETNAATSETNASNSATAAASSATSASNSATTATTKASEAATSASDAATSETNAASSASAASTSASNAATSASNASSSESAAASSASAAQAAEDAALAALDNFDDRYLGVKTSDPTVDNDGDALVAGALYYNSTDDVMKVYEGSSWVAAYASLSGALLATNNLSDLDNVTTARTNLGLGTAATTASTDYVAVTGDTMTGNLSLGDNNKAIFGASDDLQIYHDGSASYIYENGTGNLIMKASNFVIEDQDGSRLASFIEDGRVDLQYNGSEKLRTTSTGIDVTGTVIADTLNVQDASSTVTGLSFLSNTNGVNKVIDFQNSSGVKRVGFEYDNSLAKFSIVDRDGNKMFTVDEPTGDISFYEDTGTTAKFFWDASAQSTTITAIDNATTTYPLGLQNAAGSLTTGYGAYGIAMPAGSAYTMDIDGDLIIDTGGNVGIGTTSPSYKTHISNGSSGAWANGDNDELFIENSDNAGITIGTPSTNHGSIAFADNASSTRGLIRYDHSTDSLRIDVSGSEKMRIDSSGNVGIGTSSPNQKLHVNGPAEFTGTIYANSNIDMGDNDKILLGNSDDLQIYHDGTNSIIKETTGAGSLHIQADFFRVQDVNGTETKILAQDNGYVKLYYNNAEKLATTSTGIDVTGNITVSGTVDGVDIAALNSSLGNLATLDAVGAAQITDNTVGAAELNVSGNGTSGQFLSSDGDGSFSWADAGGGGYELMGAQRFTSSGTWTKTTNDINMIEIHIRGGGGGSLACGDPNYSIGGGAGGGGGTIQVSPNALGNSQTITVGAGGTGQNASCSNRAGSGGQSKVGNLVTANGGQGGNGGDGNALTPATGGTSSTNLSTNYNTLGSGATGGCYNNVGQTNGNGGLSGFGKRFSTTYYGGIGYSGWAGVGYETNLNGKGGDAVNNSSNGAKNGQPGTVEILLYKDA